MRGVFYLKSSYSLLESNISIPALVESCKEASYDFVALSDKSNMHGFFQFFEECKKHRIKPVYGLEIQVEFELLHTTFLVYAKNNEGFSNLLKLATISNMKSPVSNQDFLDHQRGLIKITAGSNSFVDSYLAINDTEKAQKGLDFFRSKLDDLYIGLEANSSSALIENMLSVAKETRLKVLPIHETRYLHESEKDIIGVLSAIAGNTSVNDKSYQFMCVEEIEKSYPFELGEDLRRVVDEITFLYEMPNITLPKFPLAESLTSNEYLNSLARTGLKRRLKNDGKTREKAYQERLVHELNVIIKMGFADYFLIVYDFVRYAKTNNILVGPGRGSAAGSLVSYVLGITEIDPIKYNLLFERFLNPERTSMPDIDLDFPDDKRANVIEYVKEKYGISHIASITAFSRLAKRSSIRDVCRVLNLPMERATAIITADEKDLVDESDHELVAVLKLAKSLEGLPRQTSTHAAGIVLSSRDLHEIVPLKRGAFSFYQTQLEAADLEKMGLLKIDFLGLKNLTIIENVIESLKQRKIDIEISQIPLNDSKTYQLFQRADTSGIFQLESGGMRRVLINMVPTNFTDIYNVLALYRPGPMENIPEFIARREGKKFDLIHPTVDKILTETYGIIVFQEQIMEIANQYAGYSYAEADLLRRGMSRKELAILEGEKKNFLSKSLSMGRKKEQSEDIYNYILKFADYGFNKSHSVAYAMVSYWMAFLKANYYREFMIELMSNVSSSTDAVTSYIEELRSNKIQVYPPNINHSGNKFVMFEDKIIYPLSSIRGIGEVTYQKIALERQRDEFKSFDDFKRRSVGILSNANLNSLIDAGALDIFEKREFLKANNSYDVLEMKTYFDDFVAPEKELSMIDLINNEKEALGFNLQFNPLDIYQELIVANGLISIEAFQVSKTGLILAMVERIKKIKTKKGDEMAFLTISDGIKQIEVTVFPEHYRRYKRILSNNVYIMGLSTNDYKENSYILNSIKKVERTNS